MKIRYMKGHTLDPIGDLTHNWFWPSTEGWSMVFLQVSRKKKNNTGLVKTHSTILHPLNSCIIAIINQLSDYHPTCWYSRVSTNTTFAKQQNCWNSPSSGTSKISRRWCSVYMEWSGKRCKLRPNHSTPTHNKALDSTVSDHHWGNVLWAKLWSCPRKRQQANDTTNDIFDGPYLGGNINISSMLLSNLV